VCGQTHMSLGEDLVLQQATGYRSQSSLTSEQMRTNAPMKSAAVVLCPLNHHRASSALSFRLPKPAWPQPLGALAAVFLWALWLLGVGPAASSVTFTTDTLIAYTNSEYDGQEIVVSNCTVTVDGAHSFLDVHVLSGGVLTHSAAPSAVIATNLGSPGLCGPVPDGDEQRGGRGGRGY